MQVIPAKPIFVALYINYLLQTSKMNGPIEGAVNTVSWTHHLAGVEDPTDYILVKEARAGAKRILAQSTTKKEHITLEILETLVDRFGGADASLSDIRTLTMCLVGFAGFFSV